MDYLGKRQQYAILRAQLENERASFLSHWRDLGDYIIPRRPRFFTSDVNRGDRRNQKIIDSTATLAERSLRSGMMAGVTSPARTWFKLATPDPAMMEIPGVKGWLQVVSQRMNTVFLKSNLYNVLPIVYGDLGTFATSAMIVEEDFDDVLRFYPFPIGSYCLSNNHRMRVDTFTRDFKLTVRQLVEKFGKRDGSGNVIWDNFSTQVRNMWANKQFEEWIEVCHIITPNIDFDPKKLTSKHKRYSSCYFETGISDGTGQTYLAPSDEVFLSESGYDYFPILAPRWEVNAEDAYGTDCPGMAALGDIKALQLMQKRKSQAIDKMVNPPMVGPTSLRNVKTTILPGDITYSDEREGQKGFRPAHEVNLRIQELAMDIQEHQSRIRKAFYEDLFLMLSTSDRRDITAREIDERHEEKLLALGPVLEQLNQDLLDPLIDIAFEIMSRQGLIPEPPQELAGMDLKVEYLSIMAQSQKLIGISAVERFSGFINQIVPVVPQILDKVDTDQLVDVYAELTSVPPGIVRSDEDVEAMRQQKAKAAAAQAATEQMQNMAGAAKDMSKADLQGDNALSRMINDSQAGSLVQ